jgi:hypothetical protein
MMLKIAPSPSINKAVENQSAASARLRRVRRIAAKHSLAICSSLGGLTLVTTATDRPRSIHGLAGVSLDVIAQALPTPPNKGPRRLDDATIDKGDRARRHGAGSQPARSPRLADRADSDRG